jgi:hypothetical protein
LAYAGRYEQIAGKHWALPTWQNPLNLTRNEGVPGSSPGVGSHQTACKIDAIVVGGMATETI